MDLLDDKSSKDKKGTGEAAAHFQTWCQILVDTSIKLYRMGNLRKTRRETREAAAHLLLGVIVGFWQERLYAFTESKQRQKENGRGRVSLPGLLSGSGKYIRIGLLDQRLKGNERGRCSLMVGSCCRVPAKSFMWIYRVRDLSKTEGERERPRLTSRFGVRFW